MAYGGLHWSYTEISALTINNRRIFVEALERQLEYERKQMDKK